MLFQVIPKQVLLHHLCVDELHLSQVRIVQFNSDCQVNLGFFECLWQDTLIVERTAPIVFKLYGRAVHVDVAASHAATSVLHSAEQSLVNCSTLFFFARNSVETHFSKLKILLLASLAEELKKSVDMLSDFGVEYWQESVHWRLFFQFEHLTIL